MNLMPKGNTSLQGYEDISSEEVTKRFIVVLLDTSVVILWTGLHFSGKISAGIAQWVGKGLNGGMSLQGGSGGNKKDDSGLEGLQVALTILIALFMVALWLVSKATALVSAGLFHLLTKAVFKGSHMTPNPGSITTDMVLAKLLEATTRFTIVFSWSLSHSIEKATGWFAQKLGQSIIRGERKSSANMEFVKTRKGLFVFKTMLGAFELGISAIVWIFLATIRDVSNWLFKLLTPISLHS